MLPTRRRNLPVSVVWRCRPVDSSLHFVIAWLNEEETETRPDRDAAGRGRILECEASPKRGQAIVAYAFVRACVRRGTTTAPDT